MANEEYPSTANQPMQTIDFMLANGQFVRTLLSPIPDATGTKIVDVDVLVAVAGSYQLSRLDKKEASRTVMDAGQAAYEFATHESKRLNTPIIQAQLEGEEFIERADMQQIVTNLFPVTVK